MANKNHPRLLSFDFFVIRRPDFPLSLFLNFSDICTTNDSFADPLKDLLTNHKGFLEALYIASPGLYERTKSWLAGEVISEETKLVKTLYKYLVRICSRGTPYGLFSGVAVGLWGDETEFVLNQTYNKVHVEVDVLLLNKLVESILENDSFREMSLFYSNNSIYYVGDELRYVEYTTNDVRRSYYLSSIANTELLESTLLLAKNGCYLSDLRDGLLLKGISQNDAGQFLNDLVSFQLLVSDLYPRVTDISGIRRLMDKLEQFKGPQPPIAALAEISSLMESSHSLTDIGQRIKDFVKWQFNEKLPENLVHVTLQQNYKSAHIENSCKNTLEDEFTQLLPLLGGNSSPDLDLFKKEFYSKYGDAEVPLSIALDGELGVDYGYHSRHASIPVLEGLNLVPVNERSRDYTKWDQFVLDIYLRYIDECSEEINLGVEDFGVFTTTPAINPSFYAYGNLLRDETDDFKFHLNLIGGNSATTMLARFSVSNPDLMSRLQQITKYEAEFYKDCIVAEIVFLPESRTSNVLSHPPLYPFEIPYLTRSSLRADNQLHIDDLMISISQNGKVILRSKKFNKRVITRLSNAHNYSSELPVYRLLCDIQSEYSSINFSWRWSILEHRTVLPRVSFGHIILSRKTWKIVKGKLTDLDEFIIRYRVPRYVQLIQGDNELLLDLDLSLARDILADEIEKKGEVQLKEFLSLPSKCVVHDHEGCYTNEIVIPLRSTTDHPNPEKLPSFQTEVQRKFVFGDEWVFIQVYGGITVLDKILVDIVNPLCKNLLEENIIQKWFFIRYQDPFPHIRLRFLTTNNLADSFNIVNRLRRNLATLLEQKMVDKIILDTYERELERYGAENIELAETLFFLDSGLILDVISKIKHYDIDGDRWLFACKTIDSILTSFGLSVAAKTSLMKGLEKVLLKAYADESSIEIQLNAKFRLFRSKVADILENEEDYAEGHISQLITKYTSTLTKALKNSTCSFEDDQIGAFVHMCCNRLFLSEPREQELLVYHFLYKYYKGEKARTLSER